MIKVEYMEAEDRAKFDEDLERVVTVESLAEGAAAAAEARREFAERHGDLVLVRR